MAMIQRVSAALALAIAVVLAPVGYSFAEIGVVGATGNHADRDVSQLVRSANRADVDRTAKIAQADTKSAAAPPPAAAAPAPANPPPAPAAASPPPAGAPAAAQDDKAAAAPPAKAVFPTAVDPKYAHQLGLVGRMRTCADQFNANKATNANAGMKWIDRSGGYYLQCSRLLKGKG